MPALPPVPNVLKIHLNWADTTGITFATGLHFLYSGGPPSATDCTTLASDIMTQLVSHLLAQMTANYEIQSVTVQDIASNSGNFGIYAATNVGTLAGNPNPISVTMVIDYLVARRYRGGKPKGFFPFGATADVVTLNQWSGTRTAAVKSAWDAFRNGVIGATSGTTAITAQCNVSYYAGFTNVPYGSPTKYRRVPTLRAGGPLVDGVTGSQVRTFLGSQRRRILAA